MYDTYIFIPKRSFKKLLEYFIFSSTAYGKVLPG